MPEWFTEAAMRERGWFDPRGEQGPPFLMGVVVALWGAMTLALAFMAWAQAGILFVAALVFMRWTSRRARKVFFPHDHP